MTGGARPAISAADAVRNADVVRDLLANATAEELATFAGLLAAEETRRRLRLVTSTGNGSQSADALLDAGQLAAALTVPLTAIREWTRGGRIPVERMGRFCRYNLAAVKARLAADSKIASLGRAKRPRSNGHNPASLTGDLPVGDQKAGAVDAH